MQNLLVAVLGNRSSGKSHTWTTLFGGRVRTGRYSRQLAVSATEEVEVFLVNGSCEERGVLIENVVPMPVPRIVLCSVQYAFGERRTIEFFAERDFLLYVHWLNPGWSDQGHVPDRHGLVPYMLHRASMIGIRDGRIAAQERVEEMRQFIHGWAAARQLVQTPVGL